MKNLSIAELYKAPDKYGDKEITVDGWVRTLRDSKTFGFIGLNDWTYLKNVQVVFEEEYISNFKEITKQNIGAAVTVKGKLVLTPGATQPFEIKASEITVCGESTPDYPIQNKRHTFEYLRTLPHLRARTNTFSAVFRLRSNIAFAIHKFFNERGFVYTHTPIITGSDCEGAGEMFRVTTLDMDNPPKTEDGQIDYSQDFFGKSTNLTVSGQLNGETYATAFGNIYTFGPTFRAENSNTARHAAEFWMIEPEMAFADLTDYMDVAEAMVKYIINYLLENAPEEMEFFNNFVYDNLSKSLFTIFFNLSINPLSTKLLKNSISSGAFSNK